MEHSECCKKNRHKINTERIVDSLKSIIKKTENDHEKKDLTIAALLVDSYYSEGGNYCTCYVGR